MRKKSLSTEHLQAMLKAFKEQHGKEYPLIALGYFGSYARNEATPDSDIDVVFQTDTPDLFLTAMLKQDIEALLVQAGLNSPMVLVLRAACSVSPRSTKHVTRSHRLTCAHVY